ncbi:hypothetical protein ACEPPN_015147 [Leptodophora sp. 'Broadleaf-Isolate-01']
MGVTGPAPTDTTVYADLPPTYGLDPSPGKMTYDKSSKSWKLASDPPKALQAVKRGEGNEIQVAVPRADQLRSHARELIGRQSPGGFLDANFYKYMGCGDDAVDNDTDDETVEGIDLCADDNLACGDAQADLRTTNGASPTQDPAPAEGAITGPITSAPPTYTGDAPSLDHNSRYYTYTYSNSLQTFSRLLSLSEAGEEDQLTRTHNVESGTSFWRRPAYHESQGDYGYAVIPRSRVHRIVLCSKRERTHTNATTNQE